MKFNFIARLSLMAAMMMLSISVFGQGVTTSSLNGRITDTNGEPLIGANVLAVHTPSGSTYGNATDIDGFFRIRGMRVGGPYKITVSYTGFEEFVQEDIYLTLGQSFRLNTQLQEAAIDLGAVEVVSYRTDIFDGNRTGAETTINIETINSTPTLARSIGDFVKFNPQASIDEGNDGLEISIGGMNNRYNAIYIDGAVNNDVFGLAGSGTNGGQTGVSPISLDAIEEFHVSVAPFDVRQSGFAGGSISAITRSGSNQFKGSAYFLSRNEDLAGKTPQEEDQDFERTRLEEFTAQTYGAWISGPIVKDKVFFFLSGELQRDETPQPFNLANYNGNATEADINGLVNHLQETYGFDPGVYDNNTAFLDSDKFLGKIDVNLNQNNKLTVRHSYTQALNLEARNSSGSGIRFINGSEYFSSTTNSSAIELNTIIGNKMSNNLTIGATFVRDDRDPYDNTNDGPSVPFPAVFIDDGRGGFTFGSETFSTANLLDQDIITINNNFEYFSGRHTFLVGANLEFYRTKNLFIPFNYGDYEWDRSEPITGSDLSDFINGEPSSFFIRSYSLRDNVTGDESVAGVEFNGAQYGFYIQDEFQAADNLKLIFGLRGDLQTFEDTPENTSFNTNTVPLLEQFWDLQGARTGDFIDPQFYFSPRFGFNYDVNGDKVTQIRGGAGIFTSRIPLVWPGGAYNNNGVNRGTFLGDDIPFEPSITKQQPGDVDVNNPEPSGDIDIFAADFKIPQVAKFNLAVDRKLPWGLIGTVEGVYTKFINQVYYQNLNLRPAVGNLTGSGDTRAIFDRRDEVDPTYGRIILGSNNNKGYAYNLSATLTKPFKNGFTGSISYSYGDSWSIYDGTSSQNSSQWRGLHAVNGRNTFDEIQRSDFAQGHRIIGQVSYKIDYAGFASTQIGLVYNGQSGNPYSYIIGSGQNLTSEDSRNRALFYVPTSQNDINLIDITDEEGNVITSATEQWNQLNEFIESDDYLSERRGQYAERNQSRTPFENILDLRVLQDFYIEMANGQRNTLQISVDILNFTNLLNKNWGKRYNRTFGGYEVVEFEGFEDDGTTPTYTFSPFTNNEPYYGDLDDRGVISSRWQMQLGLRYIFGGN